MSRTTLKEKITATRSGRFAWEQERSILEITELACEIMERENVSRAELAARLGKTRGYITQMLDGTANMTVRTISDVFTALGYSFHPDCARLDRPERRSKAAAEAMKHSSENFHGRKSKKPVRKKA